MASVLLVGGAGYIGSVCGAVLASHGHRVVVYDDLSTGHREAVGGELVEGDVRDRARLREVLRAGRFDAVMHFAALALVGESVAHPHRYFDVNVGGTAALARAMVEEGVRAVVFSSSCAVLGDPVSLPMSESHPVAPVNPYGRSKAMAEEVLRAGLQAAILRYFNAAGALPDGSLGESHAHETHLVPLALGAALGSRGPLVVHGADYDTPDGTCVRDYVHVLDLAQAHRLALERLLAGQGGGTWHLGTGRGHSVREVLATVERVTGRAVPHEVGPRRPGDPPALVADPSLARSELGWRPDWLDLEATVATAARWAEAPRY